MRGAIPLHDGQTTSFLLHVMLQCSTSLEQKNARLSKSTSLMNSPQLSSPSVSPLGLKEEISVLPVEEVSYAWSSPGDNNLCMAKGISSSSNSPRSPSHGLVGIRTPSHGLSYPSTSKSLLCNAQHVAQIMSTDWTACKRIPVFNILHLPFIIQNVHSTSFLIDSNHSDHQISSWNAVLEKGGMVLARAWYPLSNSIHTPLYFTLTVSPFCISYSSKMWSLRISLHLISHIKVSNNTTVLSFHEPGCPRVLPSIRRQWLTVMLQVCVQYLLLNPLWVLLRCQAQFSWMTCVASLDA